MSEVSFVFKGEEVKLDPDKPEDLEQIKSGLEKGALYDSKMHEIAEEKKTLEAVKTKAEMFEQFDGLLQGVRNGTADPDVLIKAINEETGLKLSKAEKEGIADGEFFDQDSKLVQKLFDRIDKLDKKIDDTNTNGLIAAKEESEHTRLETKLNGKDGMPAYNRDEIDDYCKETGFFMKDIGKQFELAYQLKYKNEIATAEKALLDTKKTNLNKIRKDDAVEGGQQNSYSFKEKPIETKNKSYHELAQEAASRAKEEGISVFIDD